MNLHNQRVPTPTPAMAVSSQQGQRGQDGIVFASQVRDATGASGGSASGAYISDPFINYDAKGLRLFVNIATGAATGTTTVKVQVQDVNAPGASGAWWDLAGAVTVGLLGNATGAMLTIYPGIASGANVTVNHHLGLVWRLVATQALAPATFTVSADYLS